MILFVIWVIGAVVTIYPLQQWLLKEVGGYKPDSFDKIMSCVFGFLVSGFWPLIIVGFVAVKSSKVIWNKILGDDKVNEKVD